jgi:hypothetical protein
LEGSDAVSSADPGAEDEGVATLEGDGWLDVDGSRRVLHVIFGESPFFLVKRLVVFFHMVVALSLQIYIWGFQLVTRYTNIILEYGL